MEHNMGTAMHSIGLTLNPKPYIFGKVQVIGISSELPCPGRRPLRARFRFANEGGSWGFRVQDLGLKDHAILKPTGFT